MAQMVFRGSNPESLVPESPSRVGVDSEDLSFDVAPSLDHAAVRAAYRLSNRESTPASVDVGFVFVRGEESDRHATEPDPGAQVTVDGEPILFRRGTRDEVTQVRGAWLSSGSREALGLFVFHLDLPPAASRTVVVRYDQGAGEDRTTVNPSFTYEYLLSPARNWAGFGQLHVTVAVPKGVALTQTALADGGGARLSASPRGASSDAPSVFRLESSGLPLGELDFRLMSRDGLLFGLTTPAGYWAIFVAALVVASTWLSRRLGRRWARIERPAWRALVCIVATGPLVLA